MRDGEPMGNKYRISIITVSYNAGKTIEQAIRSVVCQTYENIEYIIIDGMSTDNTVDIIKKYKNNLFYWVSEKDCGIYDAMNKGIKAAGGDYVYFLGADDCLFQKNTIQTVVDCLCDDVDVLSAGVYLVDEELKVERYIDGSFAKKRDQFNGAMIPHQGMFVRRSLFESERFDLKYKVASDYDFFLRLYLDPNIVFSFSKTVIAYYSSGGISTHSYETNKEYIDIMNKYHLDTNIPFHARRLTNIPWKQIVKEFLRKIGLMKFFLKRLGGRQHSCEWALCRWCGRKEM